MLHQDMDDDCPRKPRDPLGNSGDPLDLTDLTQHIPASAPPITRSLSKSSLRDPSQKHPPPPRAQVIDRAEDDISVQPSTTVNETCGEHAEDLHLLPKDSPSLRVRTSIAELPTEVLDSIVSHVGGQLGSATSSGNAGGNWSSRLRHPRRKDITNLALVSPEWRSLVQERIFRHIKIQGTQPALANLGDFFLGHPHLQDYVRHLQVIVPLWETKGGDVPQPIIADNGASRNIDPAGAVFRMIYGGRSLMIDQQAEAALIFRPASKKASLAEIFAYTRVLFPRLHALTIESAHCKHPPQITWFRPQAPSLLPSQPLNPALRIPSPAGPLLPELPSVRALILRGAWNVIRSQQDLELLWTAMPNLTDVSTLYHTPKSYPYMTMCSTLRPKLFPSGIKHLNLCLEGLYAKVPDSLAKWKKVYPTYHICRTLGGLLPQLETLSYTGRVCGSLFSESIRSSQLHHHDLVRTKRVDIIVKNVCRDIKATHDGAGIHNWQFILAFESLVVQAMRALAFYPDIEYLRIRYIDLDSPDGQLNPSFHLEKDEAWGFFSDVIVEHLVAARPKASFAGVWPVEETMVELESGGRRNINIHHYRAILNSLANRLY